MRRSIDLEEELPLWIEKGVLREDEATRLAQIHSARIHVEWPSPMNRQRYVLRSKGCVGRIPVSEELEIKIHPKVSVANLFKMLEYAYNLRSFELLEGQTNVDSIQDLFERLASILSKRVLDRARKGLYRDYVHRDESLPYVRGRLLTRESSRAAVRGSVHLQCEFDDNTADLDDNRILAYTLGMVPRFKLERDVVRRQVRQAFHGSATEVTMQPVEAKECLGRFYNRLNEDYRPMHGLCRFLLEHCGPSLQIGEKEFLPFVVDMPKLFESFVAEWLRAHAPSSMLVQPQYKVDLDEDGAISFQIDLVVRDRDSGKVLTVMDTKYKRGGKPEESDVQQILAYALSMGADRAILVYPSPVTALRKPARVRHILLSVGTFDLGSDPEDGGRDFLGQLSTLLQRT